MCQSEDHGGHDSAKYGFRFYIALGDRKAALKTASRNALRSFCTFFSIKDSDIFLREGFWLFAHMGCDSKQMILVNNRQPSNLTNSIGVPNQVVMF